MWEPSAGIAFPQVQAPVMAEEARSITPTVIPQTPVPPAPVPSVASLPGVAVPVLVEVPVLECEEPLPEVEGASGNPGGGVPDQSQSGSETAVKILNQVQLPQSGSEAKGGWPPSDFRIVVVDDDDASSVATIAGLYDRAAEKPFQTLSMWNRDGSYSTLYQPRYSEGRIREGRTPTATPPPVSLTLPQWSVVPERPLRTFSVFDRPRSVAADQQKPSAFSFTGSPSYVQPAPLAVPPEMPSPVTVPRPVSRASSQGSHASHLPEHINTIGTMVAGVVRDMLAAHQDDAQRRQEVQLQMMLTHKEETEIRVQDAHQSADKQIKLMREMQHMEAQWRKRELEIEKRMQKEREDHQAQLAELVRAHRENAVQKELQQKPSMRVSFPQRVESPLSSRASTPSPPHAFVYDYGAAAADNYAVIVNGDDMHVGISAQGAEQVKQAPLSYPGGDSGFCWGPTQDSITLVKEKLPTVDFPSTGNPPLAPPGYVLVPIGSASAPGHMHSTPVDTGVGSSSKADPNSQLLLHCRTQFLLLIVWCRPHLKLYPSLR